MKAIYFFTSLIILLACANSKHNSSSTPNAVVISAINFGTPKKTSDPFQIKAVRVEKNELIIDVEYGGGCSDHIFELFANSSIAKSDPPKRSIQIMHEDNDDKCKALVYKTIRFQISELAYTQQVGSKIKLQLSGWDEEIPFTLH
jgi:hypothetical protein